MCRSDSILARDRADTIPLSGLFGGWADWAGLHAAYPSCDERRFVLDQQIRMRV